MKKLHLALTAIITIGIIVGINVLFVPQTRTQPASAAFSHDNCQYPTRWSNPPEGCDNSDPAVPECTKAWVTQEAEQTCIAEFVRQYEVQGGEQVNNPPAVSTPPTVNACGGTK